MSSSASIMNQKLREGLGLAHQTVDVDLTKALALMKELESDATLLRKMLDTTNKQLNRVAPDARHQVAQVAFAASSALHWLCSC
jgi:uncharacterized radical SAM superfamily protein